jgi:hypothetical protein
MQQAKTGQISAGRISSRIPLFTMVLIVLLGVGLYASNVIKALQTSALAGVHAISQSTLEEKYGLRVNLVAVTAAGGFVDVRLKIVDGDKSKLLLADKANFPALLSERGVTLSAPEDTKSQTIEFVTGGNLFIMYPNSGDAVQRGTGVTIVFGDIALEPITAQ